MTEKKKGPAIGAKPKTMLSADDLRTPESTGAGAAAVVPEIRVGKPPGDHFIRVCPDKAFEIETNVLEVEREFYVVLRPLWPRLSAEPMLKRKLLVLYVTLHGAYGLWPLNVTLPGGRENSYNTSAELAAERAKTDWVRVYTNQVQKVYETQLAEGKDLPEPVFPDMSLDEIISFGFQDRIIDDWDHPALVRLRGLLP